MAYNHKPDNIISIKNFRLGTHTYGDTEDTNKFSVIDNLEVDKTGLLYKRDPSRKVGAIAATFEKVTKWYNAKLNNDSAWIVFAEVGADDLIYLYHPTTWAWVSTLKTFTGSHDTCQIIPFNNEVRFANGMDRDPSIYIYNYDTKFCNGTITKSAGWEYGDAQLDFPSGWAHNNLTGGDYGNLPIGHYYYKIVPIYDGVQEMALPEAYDYIYADNEQGNTLTLTYNFLASSFPTRVKSLKIYRGYAKENIDVAYNHIKTIPLNTDTDGVGSTQALAGMIGADENDKIILVDEDFDFTPYIAVQAGGAVSYVKFRDTLGEERVFTLTDGEMGNGWCSLTPGDGAALSTDRLWMGHWILATGVTGYASGAGVTGGENGCIGDNVLFDTGASWKNHQFVNWTLPVTGGNTVTILGNYGNVFRLSGGHGKVYGVAIAGTASEVGAYFSGTTTITMQFIDTGYPDGAASPLDGIEKIYTNYKYGALHNGRLFMLGLALDPDGEDEQHENWLGYSEFNQYDIAPVTNIIPLVDKRGGNGTGIISAGGYLIVFTETGIFRVDVPTIDPSGWSIEQGISTMGCTAPDSIIEAEGLVFFANASGIYAISPSDFLLYELTLDRKSDYTGSSSLTQTKITYDPHKRRLLCNFGSTVATIYVFDLEQFLANNNPSWTTMSFGDDYFQPNFFAVDENLKVFSFDNYSTSTQINELYDGVSAVTPIETLDCTIRTPWLSTEDIDFNTVWRRLQLVFKQSLETATTTEEDIIINIYTDKDDSTIAKTFTFNADNSTLNGVSGRIPYRAIDYDGEIIETVYRLALRSTYIQIELIMGDSNSNVFELHKLEITRDSG